MGNEITEYLPASITEKTGRIIEVMVANASCVTFIASLSPSYLATTIGYMTENYIEDEGLLDELGMAIIRGEIEYYGKIDKDLSIRLPYLDELDDDDEPDTIESVVEHLICNGGEYSPELAAKFGITV